MDSGTLIQFILTIFVYSFFVWRDNIAFRLAEHTVIAMMVVNSLIIAIQYIISNVLTPIPKGDITMLIGLLMGIVMFIATLGPRKNKWINRYPYAFSIGCGSAIAVRGLADLDIRRVLVSMISGVLGKGRYTPIDNIYILVIGLCIIYYFVFSAEYMVPSGIHGFIRKLGFYGMMAWLGGRFASTTLTRFSWLGTRVEFLVVTVMELLGL